MTSLSESTFPRRLGALSMLAVALLMAGGSVLAAPAAAQQKPAQPLVMLAHQQFLEGDLASAQALLREAGAKGQGGTRALAEQAFLEDATGRHMRARQLYDALKGSDQEAVIAVPSAVNLTALARFDQARSSFAALQKRSPSPQVKAYAGLWSLWLGARGASDAGLKPDAARARVQKIARGIRPVTAQQRALVALYQGKTDSSAVFAEIDALQVPEAIKRDLRTEAGLFAGAYLDYVRQDHQGALRIYQLALGQSRPAAMERPLLIQSSRALQLSSR